MRSAIGELELDEILHNRAGLNTLIKGSLQEAAVAWGLEVRRYELTEITPDERSKCLLNHFPIIYFAFVTIFTHDIS